MPWPRSKSGWKRARQCLVRFPAESWTIGNSSKYSESWMQGHDSGSTYSIHSFIHSIVCHTYGLFQIEKRPKGSAIVNEVVPGTQAEQAGLKRGDILCFAGSDGQEEMSYEVFLELAQSDQRPLGTYEG
jgi:hypothetical protein